MLKNALENKFYLKNILNGTGDLMLQEAVGLLRGARKDEILEKIIDKC